MKYNDFITEFKEKRVAVIGDIMLDKYLWGEAVKISAEAPVPVVTVGNENLRLGGAANVINNVSSLGAKVLAFGVVGDDDSGSDLCVQLKDSSVDISGIVRVPGRKTTVKTRILANNQQIIRYDVEDITPINKEHSKILLGPLELVCTPERRST